MQLDEKELFGRQNIKVFRERPKSLKEVLAQSAAQFSTKEAIVTEERSLTYEQLDEYSSRIAANLQKVYGVQKGDRVATIIGNRYPFPLVLFACVKLGAVMVPVNVKLSAEEMSFILDHSEAKVIVCEDQFTRKLNEISDNQLVHSVEHTFIIDGNNCFAQLLDAKNELAPIEIDELDPLFILYTSGTTGKPKGAVLTHVNVIHSLLNYNHVFNTDSTVKTLIAVPMFHVTGLVAQLLHMIFIGGTAFSMERYQNKIYIQSILEHQINFLFNVPTIFIMMSTDEEFRKNSFDFVTEVGFGGSPIYQQTFDLLKEAFPNAKLHNVYGATETTSPATLMPRQYPKSKLTSVGQVVPVGEIKIINSDGEECKLGEVGELYIKGPMVIKEYWRNPEANKTSFTDGYWHSGDIGTVDEDGYFYIRDRKKDMINRAGEKIFSIEVEDVLKKHEGIKEAAVIGVPDPIFGEKVKAIIASDDLTEKDIPVIKDHCLRLLAKFKVPEEYEFLDKLPKNASGKILKNSLKQSGIKM